MDDVCDNLIIELGEEDTDSMSSEYKTVDSNQSNSDSDL